jgi:hypothetical protein
MDQENEVSNFFDFSGKCYLMAAKWLFGPKFVFIFTFFQ